MTEPENLTALQAQIADNLDLWLKDSFQLYDKAGIPEKAAGDAIASLFACLISGLKALGIDPIEAGKTLADSLAYKNSMPSSRFKH